MTKQNEVKFPDNLEECKEGMSNFDGEIDEGFEEKLRTKKFFGRHTAWDFNGKVWFDNNQFYEEVWVHCSPREILNADNLRELMRMVNNKYGWG